MSDSIFSLLTDSDSSGTESNIPGTSCQYDFISKSYSSKKLAHSLSESESSVEEEKVAAKKIKSTLIGPSIMKTNKKKLDNSLKMEIKQWKDKLKCIKPNECLKYLSLAIPESILVSVIFRDVLSALKKNGFMYEIINSDETAITWIWKGISSEFSRKSHMAVIWDLDKCISLVQRNSLVVYFVEMMKKNPKQRIYLILHGTQRYFSDRNVKTEVDYALCELELTTGITHSKFNNPYDLSNFIVHLSKSVSQELYRSEQEKLEQKNTFYLYGRSHNCVKIDKDNNGMKRLWVQQISVIHRLPLDSAKVICGHHPTPYHLYEAFSKLSTIKEKQELLQDIVVGRGGGEKRLGPKMSGRIALLFANDNGDLRLPDWK